MLVLISSPFRNCVAASYPSLTPSHPIACVCVCVPTTCASTCLPRQVPTYTFVAPKYNPDGTEIIPKDAATTGDDDAGAAGGADAPPDGFGGGTVAVATDPLGGPSVSKKSVAGTVATTKGPGSVVKGGAGGRAGKDVPPPVPNTVGGPVPQPSPPGADVPMMEPAAEPSFLLRVRATTTAPFCPHPCAYEGAHHARSLSLPPSGASLSDSWVQPLAAFSPAVASSSYSPNNAFNTPRRLPPPAPDGTADGRDPQSAPPPPGTVAGGGASIGENVGNMIGGLVGGAVALPFTASKKMTDVIVANSPFAMSRQAVAVTTRAAAGTRLAGTGGGAQGGISAFANPGNLQNTYVQYQQFSFFHFCRVWGCTWGAPKKGRAVSLRSNTPHADVLTAAARRVISARYHYVVFFLSKLSVTTVG